MKLILASRSPRRHDILQWMGIPFETDICTAAEDLPDSLSAADAVQMLALFDDRLAEMLEAEKLSMKQGVAKKDSAIQEKVKEIISQ